MANFTQIYISPASDDESVYVETPGSIWRPGSRIAEEEDFEPILTGFVERVAQIYRDKVKQGIFSQDVPLEDIDGPNEWPPLNAKYKEWKERYGLDTRMWIRSGQLVEAIKAYKFTFKDVWVVGIHPRKRFREVNTVPLDDAPGGGWTLGARTDTNILMVAKVLEHGSERPGGGGIPPRPLFRPIQQRMSKNIRRYWKDYVADRGFSRDREDRIELSETEVEERAF